MVGGGGGGGGSSDGTEGLVSNYRRRGEGCVTPRAVRALTRAEFDE